MIFILNVRFKTLIIFEYQLIKTVIKWQYTLDSISSLYTKHNPFVNQAQPK